MEGGILKVGKNTSYFIFCVNNTGLLGLSNVEIQFTTSLGSFIYVVGGTIIIEYLKMNNIQSYWVNPLIDAEQSVSTISVECHSLNVTNCVYKYPGGTYNKSSIAFFSNSTSSTYAISFNMTHSVFCNISVNLTGVNNNDGGGICGFFCRTLSGFFFFFF
jgi:hypothetical protein